MNAPNDLINGLEPAALGLALGALLGELCASVLPAMRPSLTVVLLVAGQGALIAAAAAVDASRVETAREALRAMAPGAVAWALLTAAAIWSGI